MTSHALFFAIAERLGIGGGAGSSWSVAWELTAALILLTSLLAVLFPLYEAARQAPESFPMAGVVFVLAPPALCGWLVVLLWALSSGALGFCVAIFVGLAALQVRSGIRALLEGQREEESKKRRARARGGALERGAKKREAEWDLDSLRVETDAIRATIEQEKVLFPESVGRLVSADELGRARAELEQARDELTRLRVHQPKNLDGEPLGS